MFVFRTAARVTGSTIGLGREAYLYHKEKREARKALETEYPPPYPDGVQVQGEEEHGYAYRYEDEYEYEYAPVDADAEQRAREMIAKGNAVLVTDVEVPHPSEMDEDVEESIEREWEFDEEGSSPTAEEKNQEDEMEMEMEMKNKDSVTRLVDEVLHLARSIPESKPPLAFPVIIPQRRPRKKARGFIRAYAPDLNACGIDQDTFLQFLQNFDHAAEASPWLKTIYTSAAIVGFVPGHITLAVSIAVQVAAGTAIELQGRYKANKYLDAINKDLFMPRGLYVMVMRYKPNAAQAGETEIGVEDFNLNTAKSVARWAPSVSPEAEVGPPSTGMKIVQRIRLSSGVSRSNASMPTACAPLVFQTKSGEAKMQRTYAMRAEIAENTTSPTSPREGSISSSTSSHKQGHQASLEQKRTLKEKLTSANAFIQDYYDRRAQARLLAESPSSILSQQITPPVFRSRYADPNDGTNKHLYNTLTGGLANARALGERRRIRVRQIMNEERKARGLPPIEGPIGRQGIIVKCVKKVLVQDVLYLMVVNLPSEEELAEARQVLLEGGWMN